MQFVNAKHVVKRICLHPHYIGRHSLATKLQLEATDKYNLMCRLKEEELLLLQEMKSFVIFYQNSITELQLAIKGAVYASTLT